ncbi:MAG: fibrillarin-like rRNA/tRNA 2'-O-methyltransferase [Euryarchaeota archaeon]|nr:fibrillarin-like rRNA/tRNA 2'-O-methyltransferase [Euryarchaeota archaeon]
MRGASAVKVEPTQFRGLYFDGRDVLTKNLAPGESVYGERLVARGGTEYRHWDPTRSKLAAYYRCGGSAFPFEEKSHVLYLGAASGTTASHVSDLCPSGTVYCVEFSPKPFRKLMELCGRRKNMFPILADATKPESYAQMVGKVDIVYQDIAQRDQARILLRNTNAFLRDRGTAFLIVKARSVDVGSAPSEVYKGELETLRNGGLKLMEMVALDRFEKDHAAIVVRKP